eukprot:6487643-Pyramimonas_sp.AAC.1
MSRKAREATRAIRKCRIILDDDGKYQRDSFSRGGSGDRAFRAGDPAKGTERSLGNSRLEDVSCAAAF